MSDQDDWDFAGPDDAKAEIRAAAQYLLRGVSDDARGDLVREIMKIVRDVANGLPGIKAPRPAISVRPIAGLD